MSCFVGTESHRYSGNGLPGRTLSLCAKNSNELCSLHEESLLSLHSVDELPGNRYISLYLPENKQKQQSMWNTSLVGVQTTAIDVNDDTGICIDLPISTACDKHYEHVLSIAQVEESMSEFESLMLIHNYQPTMDKQIPQLSLIA